MISFYFKFPYLCSYYLYRTVFNKLGKEQEAFRELTTLMSKVASGFAIADLYPSLKLLQSIGGMKRTLKDMVKESNRILDPIIKDHKSNTQGKVDHQDLLDVLLKFHNHHPHQNNFSLSTDNIKGIILVSHFGIYFVKYYYIRPSL